MNGGTCREAGPYEKFQCVCPEGFGGFHCEVDKCRDYCKNNGKCSINPVTGPHCDCVNNFSGDKCEIDDLCPHCNEKVSNCAITCLNNGFCQKSGSNEFCKCVGEWRGSSCELPPNCIDECGKCSETSSVNECT